MVTGGLTKSNTFEGTQLVGQKETLPENESLIGI